MKYYVGLEGAKSDVWMIISQHKYILDLLDNSNLSHCKPVLTPLASDGKFPVFSYTIIDKPDLCRRVVG